MEKQRFSCLILIDIMGAEPSCGIWRLNISFYKIFNLERDWNVPYVDILALFYEHILIDVYQSVKC